MTKTFRGVGGVQESALHRSSVNGRSADQPALNRSSVNGCVFKMAYADFLPTPPGGVPQKRRTPFGSLPLEEGRPCATRTPYLKGPPCI